MTMTTQDIQGWVGRTAVGPQGEKIGKVTDIYLDEETNQPEWLAVTTGLLGNRVSFVPLQGAAAEGGDVRLPFSKDQVKDAPSADADGQLSMDEEARLYEHYGMAYSDAPSDTGLPAGGGTAAPQTAGSDDAMTRSEEELRVGTRQREAGRARLRKRVETEQVSTTVPVAHEEVRIEREPITEGNVDKALQGAEITEGVHEVTLIEEEAVAATETVPKERIRMEKDTVVEEEQVGAELRKERVEAEVDPDTRR